MMFAHSAVMRLAISPCQTYNIVNLSLLYGVIQSQRVLLLPLLAALGMTSGESIGCGRSEETTCLLGGPHANRGATPAKHC